MEILHFLRSSTFLKALSLSLWVPDKVIEPYGTTCTRRITKNHRHTYVGEKITCARRRVRTGYLGVHVVSFAQAPLTRNVYIYENFQVSSSSFSLNEFSNFVGPTSSHLSSIRSHQTSDHSECYLIPPDLYLVDLIRLYDRNKNKKSHFLIFHETDELVGYKSRIRMM